METVPATHQAQFIVAPLTREELNEMMDQDGFIRVNVAVGIEDILELDRENFMDLLSEKISESVSLEEPEFEPVDVAYFRQVVFEVVGKIPDDAFDDYLD